MKKLVFLSGIIFVTLLIVFLIYRSQHEPLSDYFNYLFGISASLFGFALIFSFLRNRRR